MTQSLNLAGWGKLVYFDTEEHQIKSQGDKRVHLARIPKLAAQWKIIYDFKPTEYLELHCSSTYCSVQGDHPIGLSAEFSSGNDLQELFISSSKKIHLDVVSMNSDRTFDRVESNQLPKLQEWSRIEISHMKEDGKYFLSLSVGGNELARKELGRILIDKANIYSSDKYLSQPGFMRGLLVLDKQ